MDSIVIDIDDTLCYTKHGYTDAQTKYGEAMPNTIMIEGVRKLHAKGYKIILHTARRMLTFNGDIDKIIADVGDITTDWLERHEVPYDELVWGKPYSSTYYVDDKSMNLQEFKEWTSSI